MKVVLAPDKFAGTLSAAAAAEAMALGWRRARGDDEVFLVPMADGGEGTIGVVESSVVGSQRRSVEVADARGRAASAAWLLLPDGRALVEVAEVCGLSRLDEADRDPTLATSYGVGQMLRLVVASDASEIVVGLGGSATVDGGAGMALALGHRLVRSDGNGIKVGARFAADLDRIADTAPPLGVPVVAAVDVANPLLGPYGAATVFGPQKGASVDDVPVLEAALLRLADVAERDLPGGPWREAPGAGAAGGLGFGLAAFAGARLDGGAAAVAELVGLGAALHGAGAVVTGEGAFDASTAAGKVPAYVVARARQAGARVGVVAGRATADAGIDVDAIEVLGPDGPDRAYDLVEERTAALARRLG